MAFFPPLFNFFSRAPKCPGSYPRLGITATRDCFMSSSDLSIISISLENVNIVPFVRIRESLMSFYIAKLKGRQTEAPHYLDHFMTFKGSGKSACALTNTGCLPLLLSSVSPAHQRFYAILYQ